MPLWAQSSCLWPSWLSLWCPRQEATGMRRHAQLHGQLPDTPPPRTPALRPRSTSGPGSSRRSRSSCRRSWRSAGKARSFGEGSHRGPAGRERRVPRFLNGPKKRERHVPGFLRGPESRESHVPGFRTARKSGNAAFPGFWTPRKGGKATFPDCRAARKVGKATFPTFREAQKTGKATFPTSAEARTTGGSA